MIVKTVCCVLCLFVPFNLVRVPNPLLWKMVGCTIPKKHGNFTSGPSRAFIWSRTGKKRWKLARWVSQQEILLWLHSDSFTESRDTAILPPPPICHFRRPNATSNLTALDQVDFSHLGLFVFLGHQFCISCSSWQLDFNIFLNSDSRNDYDSLNILASMPCLMRGNLLRTII